MFDGAVRVASINHIGKRLEGVSWVFDKLLQINLQKPLGNVPLQDLKIESGLGTHIGLQILDAACQVAA